MDRISLGLRFITVLLMLFQSKNIFFCLSKWIMEVKQLFPFGRSPTFWPTITQSSLCLAEFSSELYHLWTLGLSLTSVNLLFATFEQVLCQVATDVIGRIGNPIFCSKDNSKFKFYTCITTGNNVRHTLPRANHSEWSTRNPSPLFWLMGNHTRENMPF